MKYFAVKNDENKFVGLVERRNEDEANRWLEANQDKIIYLVSKKKPKGTGLKVFGKGWEVRKASV